MNTARQPSTTLAFGLLALCLLLCSCVVIEAGSDGPPVPLDPARLALLKAGAFSVPTLKPRRAPIVGGRPGSGLAGRKLLGKSATRVWVYDSCLQAFGYDTGMTAVAQKSCTQLNSQVGPFSFMGDVTSAQLQNKTFVQQIDLLLVYNCDNNGPIWDADTNNNVTAALKKNVIWQVMIWTRDAGQVSPANVPGLPANAVVNDFASYITALPKAYDLSNNQDTGLAPAFPLQGGFASHGYITNATFYTLPKSGGGRYAYLVDYENVAGNPDKINTFAYTVGTNNPLNVFYSTIPMDFYLGGGSDDANGDYAKIHLNAIATMMAAQ